MEAATRQLEQSLFESGDVRNRVRTVGHFLSEHLKNDLNDRSIAVMMDNLEGGDILIRCEKQLPDGYSLLLFSERLKTYKLETKADVLRWISDTLRKIRMRYEEMPEIRPKLAIAATR